MALKIERTDTTQSRVEVERYVGSDGGDGWLEVQEAKKIDMTGREQVKMAR